MSLDTISKFREAINENEDWQEEIRNFGSDDSIISYASNKGYEFTEDEFTEYVENNASGELSLFEMELVSGGAARQGNTSAATTTRHSIAGGRANNTIRGTRDKGGSSLFSSL